MNSVIGRAEGRRLWVVSDFAKGPNTQAGLLLSVSGC